MSTLAQLKVSAGRSQATLVEVYFQLMFAGPRSKGPRRTFDIIALPVNVEKITNGVWFTDHLSSFLPLRDKAADFSKDEFFKLSQK
ncbi:hypothetical protein [Nitrosospira sp. Nsp1]|uniref:hypothetical protein n=1 Tax=Nitrosospira sp. Nsp1 TaxID=136547 RepID=UPI000B88F64E|nr:hypothetical protein [Nitrosospira sp. Nsp1]